MVPRDRFNHRSTVRGSRSSIKDTAGNEQHTIPPEELPLPHATRQLFRACLPHCRNTGLLFDRYTLYHSNWKLSEFKLPDKNKKDSAKSYNLDQVREVQQRCREDAGWKDFYTHFLERWNHTVKSKGGNPFKMVPVWRFIVGMGNKTALEVGFTFHRIYGFPVIPGSALKGLARAAAIEEIANILGIEALPLSEAIARHDKLGGVTPLEELDNLLMADDERLLLEERQKQKLLQREAEALKNIRLDPGVPMGAPIKHNGLESYRGIIKNFRNIFGTPHAQGQAVFFDALPADPAALELGLDVMNVHYQEYYGEKKDAKDVMIPPADYLEPKPIPFLTVVHSPFLFALGWQGKVDEEDRDRAIIWLKKGLMEHGVGAKTAAGYGYFVGGEKDG